MQCYYSGAHPSPGLSLHQVMGAGLGHKLLVAVELRHGCDGRMQWLELRGDFSCNAIIQGHIHPLA